MYFIDYAITVFPFFSPLYSPLPCTPPPTIIAPPYFMSVGRIYKFFGFSTYHTILNLPLSILYLPITLLIPCTFSPIVPPTSSPLITLHVISTSVNLFLFQLFAYFIFVCVCLGLVVDSCEFVVILFFIFLIFSFLGKSL